MENYKEEIAKLQTQLDELKNKIEKPRYIEGKWYKALKNKALYYIVEFNGINKDGKNYGFDYDGHWMELNDRFFSEVNDIEATPKEVEEALTKEAVKRFPIGTKFKSLNGINDRVDGHVMKFENGILLLGDDYNRLELFNNGTWATPIKTKTIDEIVNDIFNCNSKDAIKKYLLDEDKEIIETLNNL